MTAPDGSEWAIWCNKTNNIGLFELLRIKHCSFAVKEALVGQASTGWLDDKNGDIE